MTSGVPAPEIRCIEKNKYGRQCGNAGSPFTFPPHCFKHHGYSPNVQKVATERARQYELGMLEPLDPPALRRLKLRAFEATQAHISRRQMKKAGILEDYDRTTAQVQKQAKVERARELEVLGPEKVAERQRGRKAFQEWMLASPATRGPCPVDSATFEFNSDLTTTEEIDPDPAADPEPTTKPTTKPTPDPEAWEPPEPTPEPEPPKERFWERRGEQQREARRQERQRDLRRRPKPAEQEVLPEGGEDGLGGGGTILTGVQPLTPEEADAERQRQEGSDGVWVGEIVYGPLSFF